MVRVYCIIVEVNYRKTICTLVLYRSLNNYFYRTGSLVRSRHYYPLCVVPANSLQCSKEVANIHSQINPANILLSWFYKIHFKTTFPILYRSSQGRKFLRIFVLLPVPLNNCRGYVRQNKKFCTNDLQLSLVRYICS